MIFNDIVFNQTWQILDGTIKGIKNDNLSIIDDNVFMNCSLIKAFFPNCTSIGNSAFQYCSALTTISFPNCISIGSSAFYMCSALITVSFPNCINIDTFAFASCYSLTTASFPNVTNIGNYAFAYCSSLTTISFPSATSIGNYAFAYCSSLTTASFPNAISIGNYAFRNCSSLTTTSFSSVTSIGTGAFIGCDLLTTASFPSATSIGNSAFYGCDLLTTASFPNVTNIGNFAFYGCNALTTANFPNATSIGNSVFYSCTSLTTANFPNATSIGNSVFQCCFNLLSFYLLGSSIPTLGTSVFDSTPIGGYTTSTSGVYGSIFVPSSLYNSYLIAENWSLYSERIVSYNGSSASSSASFAMRFTQAWLDNGTVSAPTKPTDYMRIPGGSISDQENGNALKNLTYEIITNEAFPLAFSGWTHYMGDGPQLFISSAIPTDIDYLGTKIYEHPDNGLGLTSFYSTITVPSGNLGNFLTAHIWAEDDIDCTICDFSSVHEIYSDVHYLVRL